MSDIIFNEEKDFEEAVIKALIEHGWESDVIRYPSEEDLIQNWANILFNNNKQGTRLAINFRRDGSDFRPGKKSTIANGPK